MNDILREDAEKFAGFLVEHYPPALEWCDPVGYCAWNIAKGFIAAAINDDGKIVAMCAMRPVDRPGLGVLPYYYNHDGSNLHIDLLVDETSDERAIASFRALFGLRFGPRKTVAMFRHHEESLHVYSYTKFWNKLASVKKRQMKKDNKHYGIATATTTAPAA
jgi:hypothetical protein